MHEERVVLCASNAYERKYYLNQDFTALPQTVRDELKAMCVLYTEDVGGVLSLGFEGDGTLVFEVNADEGDLLFDEIGSALLIKRMQEEKKELLSSLELYYRLRNGLNCQYTGLTNAFSLQESCSDRH